MSFNMDVVINTPDESVDMKSGLETLQGVSEAVRCISETVLTDKVPERQTHKSKIRTTLKKSFTGSYGQIFSIDIFDQDIAQRFRRIGQSAFSEIIAYFLNESIYNDHQPLSDRAQRIVDGLQDNAETLTQQLRTSALREIHDIPTKFGHDVKVRFRRSRDDQTILATFDRETAKSLDAEETNETVDLIVAITRLNINTGNGRLLIKDANETVAFGFGVEYAQVRQEAKKKFSVNLDHNNGIAGEEWEHLRISAAPVKLRDGKIIKYIVKGIYP